MLTYTFSQREKILLAILAVIVVFIVWFIFVYQGTTNTITRIDSEIAQVQTEIEADQARVGMLSSMKQTIEERKAAGAKTTPMPEFDNMKPLMAELNSIMAETNTYTLTFDALNRDDDTYVARGVRIDYTCNSYDAAEDIVKDLAGGKYPCRIDSVSISLSRSGGSAADAARVSASASVHVTFYEKYPEGYVKPDSSQKGKAA